MTITQIPGVTVTFTLADGSKQSVGVILPATLTFNTGAPEIMECVGGSCDYKLDGTDAWVTSGEGQKFSVPGNAKFQIRVTEGFDAYHYICYFG
jgi:purine/pyrimidine-nucleoside phosphorylase